MTTTLSDGAVVTDAAPLLSAIYKDVLNGQSELTFQTTADSVEAGLIREEYYVVGQINGVWREFIIDSVKEKDEGALIQEVKASLSSVELNDHLVLGKIQGMNLTTGLREILSGTRWEMGTVDAAIVSNPIAEELQYMNVLEAIHELVKQYNCDVYFTYVIDIDRVVRRQVNLFRRLGTDSGKRFEISKDMLSVERHIDTTMIKTAIYPIRIEESEEEGKVITDISSVEWRVANGDPVDKPLGQKWVGDPNALRQWGRLDRSGNLIHRVKLYEFNEEVTPAVMLQMSWVSLGSYTSPKVTYTTNIVDLYQLLGEEFAHEKVVLGDTCVVIDNYFTVPIQTEDRVIELELDLIDPANSKVILGDPKASYASDRDNIGSIIEGALGAVRRTADNALASANGKNTITHGSNEPRNPRTGDSWVRPHPNDPKETQWLIWDGTQWVIEIDTMRISEAVIAGEEALAAGEEAKQAGEDALAAGEEAKQAANDAREVADEAKLAAEEAKEIGENAGLAAEEAKQMGEDAKQAADEAKQAGQDALEAGNTALEKAEQAAQDAEEAKSASEAIAIDVESVMQDVSEISDTAQSAFDKALAVEETTATLEKSVNGVTGRLTEVEETAAGTTRKVNELEITVDGQRQTIASVEQWQNDFSLGGRNYFKDSHIERTHVNEFLNHSTWDLAPLIDSHGLDRYYTVSFDLKTEVEGQIRVYSQNGSGARYNIGTHFVNATTEYQRFSVIFKPEKSGSFEIETRSLLAFFGTYGTGCIPTARNLKFELGNAPSDWSPAPEDMATVSKVNEIENTVDGFRQTISSVEEWQNDFNISARNLLSRTGTFADGTAVIVDPNEAFNGNSTVRGINTGVPYLDTYRQRTISPPRDGKFTITFWAKADRQLNFHNYFYATGTTTHVINSDGREGTASDGNNALAATTSWQKYWITWTQRNATATKEVLLGRLFGTGTLWINSPMLIEGSIPIDWSPAPEDKATVTKVNQIESTVNGTVQTVAEVKQTADSALTKATQVEQTASGIRQTVSEVQTQLDLTDIKTAIAGGLVITDDPEFRNGNNGIATYNNAGNGAVTVTRQLMAAASGGTQPTDSPYRIAVEVTGAANPAFGGIHRSTQSRVNAKFVVKFNANLPTGRRFQFANNSLGTNGKCTWLTSFEGRGTWTEYMYLVECGTSGTFSTFGHLYVMNGATPTPAAPLRWHIARYEIIDISQSQQSQITQLSDTINLKVEKNDVINQINISTEGILIAGNKVRITGTTTIDNAVIRTAHIADLAVTNGKIANLSVDTAKISDAAITNAKIGNLAVNSAKIGELAVTNGKIGNLAVTEGKIANLAVTNAKIGELAVTTGKIGQLAVTEAKIGNLAVTEGKIANLAVTNAKIANLAVNTAKIADAAITNAKIANLSADKINTGTLNAANVNIINLNASAIVSGTLNAIRITGSTFETVGDFGTMTLNRGVTTYQQSGSVYGQISGTTTASGLSLTFQTTGSAIVRAGRIDAGSAKYANSVIQLNSGFVAAAPTMSSSWETVWHNLILRYMSGGTVGNQITLDATNVTIMRNFRVTGSKNAVHVTRDGVRSTPAYETAESYLGDIGEACTGENCEIEIPIEGLFSDTVNTDIPYQVFLSAYGDSHVWVSKRTPFSFTVMSDSPNAKFTWELKAKRRGFEHERLVLQEDFDNTMIQFMYGENSKPEDLEGDCVASEGAAPIYAEEEK
ncbi:phage tail spike protein [Enterococcus sp. AZ136]|uniref:phage tail spike protein n=1 Tax=Enterococcus sp. AZ136 TaxID=2774788 RepID=UPI003D2AC919